MMSWDPQGLLRLAEMKNAVVSTGLAAHVHEAVTDVWRANRARHEPDELFDDAFTLSMLSSRNLANRLFATINSDSALRQQNVIATRDFMSTVVHVGGFNLRFIKTPHLDGREPNFVSSFDWSQSESRYSAAHRNREAYSPPIRRPEMPPLFEVDASVVEGLASGCLDVFLVWGAENEFGLTAGWLGIPTTSEDRWIAVQSLWWDETATPASEREATVGVSQVSRFEEQPEPTVSISLKPRQPERASL